MFRIRYRVFLISFLLISAANSEKEDVRRALVDFMDKLSISNVERSINWGWNSSSDPCIDKWEGVTCDSTTNQSVKKIVLDQENLDGVLDLGSLCQATSLLVLSLNNNNVGGNLPAEISNCKSLTHLYLSGNKFSSNLPASLSKLSNLKRLDLSNNEFSDDLPDMSRVSGLLTFLVQNNQLSGTIPELDFLNLEAFNVSNNNLSGQIPNVGGRFDNSSFLGNSNLCGNPLSNSCPPAEERSKKSKRNMYLIYSGYAIIGLLVFLLVAIKLIKKKINKPKEKKIEFQGRGLGYKSSIHSSSGSGSGSGSSESKTRGYRSEYSLTSAESGTVSSSLVVLSDTQVVNGMRFEDLLRAPAELVSRGKHGSLYKVEPLGAQPLVVKRIKDWEISSDNFKTRMMRIHQVKHPKVLPVVAYYCSKQEKLVVYEFQKNGSLFSLLHGSRNGQYLDWGSRLNIAASIAEALAFMHEELRVDGIAHGNLKSTNILLNNDMDPSISEYGLTAAKNEGNDSSESNESDGDCTRDTFKSDVYGFGVILLELLTGKVVQNNGLDLAQWVHLVVQEEWTTEVFDKSLVSESADEERMVNLLQVALMCINHSAEARPSVSRVAVMIFSIKEAEERSMSS